MSEKNLTIKEVAAAARVDPSTIRRWIKDGRLLAAKPVPGASGAVRIPAGNVRKLGIAVEG